MGLLSVAIGFGTLAVLARKILLLWKRESGSMGPGPWIVSLILLGPLWIVKQPLYDQPTAVKLAASAGWVGVCLLGHYIVARRQGRFFDNPIRAQLTLCVVAAAATAGSTLVLSHDLKLVSGLPGESAGPGSRPDIVLVVMDTVRADHLSLYGYGRETTPFLRELAGGARARSTAWVLGSTVGSTG